MGRRRRAEEIMRIAALVGVAMSAWLVAQYALPPSVGVCVAGGGCNTVRMCRLSSLFGVAWPQIGVAAFGCVLALTLVGSAWSRRAATVMGLGAGVSGLALIVLQKAVCHAFCPWCLVADTAGIALGLGAVLSLRARDEATDLPPRTRWTFGSLAFASVLASLLWGMTRPIPEAIPQRVAELPAPVAHEQRAGVATIVEWADFECPFCRRQQDVFSSVLPHYGQRVHLVRKNLPLVRLHPHAEDAARAQCCAEAQGRGEPMAEALFRTDDLSPQGCEAAAQRLGLDVAAYRQCLASAATTAQLDHDRADATASGVQGLPTMYIGSERFEGAITADTLRASIERALASTPAHSSVDAPYTPST